MSYAILASIPLFFILIALEWLIARKRGREVYQLDDTLTNLHLGAGQLLTGLLVKLPLVALYALVFEQTEGLRALIGLHWWPQEAFSASWLVWLVGVLLMDLAYYAFHRVSHEVNALWAAHAVHHQSEEYNLSVALRQSWLQQVYSGLFYLPLALLGVPLPAFLLLNATNTVAQFWIHTRLIDRLGPLEWVLNTPSHHRVHHGADDEYLDKNYAGLLIIWDRLFGTFEPEVRSPRYGVVKPLRSWNSGWANLAVWSQLLERARALAHTGERSALSAFVSLALKAPAAQLPEEAQRSTPQGLLTTDEGYQRYRPPSRAPAYVITQGALSLATGLWVIACEPSSSLSAVALWVGAHLMAGVTLGALSEGRSWALKAELARLMILPLLAFLVPLSLPHELNSQLESFIFTPSQLFFWLTLSSCSRLWLRISHMAEI
jgi:alkylglycerol monooxygenase